MSDVDRLQSCMVAEPDCLCWITEREWESKPCFANEIYIERSGMVRICCLGIPGVLVTDLEYYICKLLYVQQDWIYYQSEQLLQSGLDCSKGQSEV